MNNDVIIIKGNQDKILSKHGGNFVIPKGKKIIIFESEDITPEINFLLEEHAHLIYINDSQKNKTGKKRRTAILHANAAIIWFDINKNESAESEIITQLAGVGARAETYGIFYGQDENQFLISHTTEHLAPNTHSIMETKGVLDAKSRASIKSLIKIHPGMTGCTGHERIDTLLLSKNAHIDAIPNLEIGNNDVQCTHAVTTSRLNPEKLFYLEGRGLGETDAVDMLVSAQFESIFQKIPKIDILSVNFGIKVEQNLL